MEFKGLEKISLIDYPGKVASIAFTGGCNFRCHYCYNRELVLHPEKLPSISGEQVIDFLSSRKEWLDGLVITGGEPTIHRQLPEFIRKVKAKGFLVKLDTNGTNPQMLEKLIKEKLVDYVAMDVKAPLEWEKYSKVAGISDERLFRKVRESIALLLEGKVGYEFRTTIVPGLLTKEDILTIARQLKGAKRYAIQQFRPQPTVDPAYEKERPFPLAEARKLQKQISKIIPCELRG